MDECAHQRMTDVTWACPTIGSECPDCGLRTIWNGTRFVRPDEMSAWPWSTYFDWYDGKRNRGATTEQAD